VTGLGVGLARWEQQVRQGARCLDGRFRRSLEHVVAADFAGGFFKKSVSLYWWCPSSDGQIMG